MQWGQPGLIYVAMAVARIMSRASEVHINACAWLFGYIKWSNVRNPRLRYYGSALYGVDRPLMECYADASFSDTEKGGSTGFSVIFLSGIDGKYKMAIDWTRTVQSGIAISSMEAEIIEQSKGSSRCLVVVYLADQRGWDLIPFMLYGDNTSGIRVICEPQLYARSAHIRRHYFHCREMTEFLMIVKYVSTILMLADYQTKFGLPTGTIHRFLLVFMTLDYLKDKK